MLRDPTRRKEYDQSLESPTYGATTAYTKSGTRVVVTKRTNRTWWFFGLAACVLLWFNWNTYVRGTEEEEDIYIKNPRLYFDAKNQTKET